MWSIFLSDERSKKFHKPIFRVTISIFNVTFFSWMNEKTRDLVQVLLHMYVHLDLVENKYYLNFIILAVDFPVVFSFYATFDAKSCFFA